MKLRTKDALTDVLVILIHSETDNNFFTYLVIKMKVYSHSYKFFIFLSNLNI